MLAQTRGDVAAEGFLRHRFSGTNPLPWHYEIPTVPWEAIWSLNIDDSMEYAYAGSDGPQTARTYLPSDRDRSSEWTFSTRTAGPPARLRWTD